MKKTPFQNENDKFKIKPKITSTVGEEEVAKRLLLTYFGYWGTYAFWLIIAIYQIPVIFVLGALMWIIGGITAWRIKPERANIGRKTRFTMLLYVGGLVAFQLISALIHNTPIETWEHIFMAELPAAFSNTVINWLSMAFIVTMFMGFAAYLNYILQLFMFHRAETDTKDYMTTMTRREEDRQ